MTAAGLPTGHGIHAVNDFGGLSEDIFIPPRRGTFSPTCMALFLRLSRPGRRPGAPPEQQLAGPDPEHNGDAQKG